MNERNPIILEPQFRARVWGGNRIASMYGIEPAEPIGEAWLVYDGNRIADGPFAGRVLQEVLQELGDEFLGEGFIESYGSTYPLIVKLIDAAEWLSVQVHPNDEYAARVESHTGYSGKDEAWLILDAAPGARIVYGVAHDVTKEEFRESLLRGDVDNLLNYVEVEQGDFVYLPAGTIHALGPGLLVLEVSQRSDLTYRIHDYGRGRQLHIDKALDVANLTYEEPSIEKLDPGVRKVFPNFSMGYLKDGLKLGCKAGVQVGNRVGSLSSRFESQILPAGFDLEPRVGEWWLIEPGT